jgi:hypothetical protein
MVPRALLESRNPSPKAMISLAEVSVTLEPRRSEAIILRALGFTQGIDDGWLRGYLLFELAARRATTDLVSSLELALEAIEHERRSGSRVHLVFAVGGAATWALPQANRFDAAIVGDEFRLGAEMAMPYFQPGVEVAKGHLTPARIVELRQQARSMSFSDFADYARSEIEAALADLESA